MDIKTIKGSIIVRNDTINNYIKDIAQYSVLSPKEEETLIERVKQGDEEARNMLINCNQRFVFAIAKRYASDSTVMDLVNEGNLGLIEAIERYVPDNGVRLLSYAVWYIRRNIVTYLTNDNLLIKKSNNMKIGTKTTTIENRFFCENGRYPSTNEIIDILNEEFGLNIINKCDVEDIEVKSINSKICDNDDDNTIENSYAFVSKTASYNDYEDKIESEYTKNLVKNMLSILKERDSTIIKMAFGIGYDKEYTNSEIGEELGYSAERIRQIKDKLKLRLQAAAKHISV